MARSRGRSSEYAAGPVTGLQWDVRYRPKADPAWKRAPVPDDRQRWLALSGALPCGDHTEVAYRQLAAWPRHREGPCAIEDFLPRAIQANHVVPALGDGQTIGRFGLAAAELDADPSVLALLSRH